MGKFFQKNLSGKTAWTIFFVLVLAVFLLPHIAWGLDVGREFGDATGLTATDPRIILARIVQIVLGFLAIIAVSLVIYGGFLWMTSAGNQEKVAKAKRVLVNAVIGLIIILSSFDIASFVLSSMLDSGSRETPGPGHGTGPESGLCAIGSCAIESVYPEPYQTDVPRNTSIIVTFKEEIDPSTIENGSGYISTSSVRIYKENDPDNLLSDVQVHSSDNKTFVFVPDEYLGSPSEYIWYFVDLTNNITTVDGNSIYDGCKAKETSWKFEVSNKLDLTPPKVKKNGLRPAPDDARDSTSSVSELQNATGTIEVADNSAINFYEPATTSSWSTLTGSTDIDSVNMNISCSYSGTLEAVILSSGNDVQLKDSDGNPLTQESLSGDSVTFPGYFTLNFASTPSSGDSWQIDVVAEQTADNITVGSQIYTFVENGSTLSGNQIEIGSDAHTSAVNIANTINNHSKINAYPPDTGSVVKIEAVVGGDEGNNIILDSSDNTAFNVTPMHGGQDEEEETTIEGGKKDEYRNVVIHIEFNEAINPIHVSGQASDVSDYIRVVNVDTDPTSTLAGKFMVSNGYKTVEFISDTQCGTNSCGEPVYCLPGNSHLQVELTAANLYECSSDDNCVSRSPYNNCSGVAGLGYNACQNDDGENYPLSSDALDGIMDAALNSLDGNRNEYSQGPNDYYDENATNTSPLPGDNYRWSFFINDESNIGAPEMISAHPRAGETLNDLAAPIEMGFDKLMMSSSLKTGSKQIYNGEENVEHKLINLWHTGEIGLGYWIGQTSTDTPPRDGYPDQTTALIKHATFGDSMTFRAQAGSGIKDIYQNCYKPSEGPDCDYSSEGDHSCCNGTVVSSTDYLTTEGSCP